MAIGLEFVFVYVFGFECWVLFAERFSISFFTANANFAAIYGFDCR